jgi:uncharacterized protein (TIGR03437 family)
MVQVQIDGADAPLDEVRPERIALTLPAGLRAGMHSVQVRHGVRIGTPWVTRPAFSSNLGTFVLQPRITQTAGQYNIDITNVQGSGTAPRSATVGIAVQPAALPEQQVTLELLTARGVVYTFFADPRANETDQLTFAVVAIAAGDYLFRVRVDGAESPLELDANRQPVAPQETIP